MRGLSILDYTVSDAKKISTDSNQNQPSDDTDLNQKQIKKKFSKLGCLGCLALILLVLLLYLGFRDTSRSLDMMEQQFFGNHSRALIKKKLNQAMKIYNLQINEDNYNRVGGCLLSLKHKNTGISEMEMLEYMIDNPDLAENVSFFEAAGVAAIVMGKGWEIPAP